MTIFGQACDGGYDATTIKAEAIKMDGPHVDRRTDGCVSVPCASAIYHDAPIEKALWSWERKGKEHTGVSDYPWSSGAY
jgi:hypothetical protein